MQFIHLKDENDQLKVTIAYDDTDPIVLYGVSCVSDSETLHGTNKKKGRLISSGRLNKLTEWNEDDLKRKSDWKTFKRDQLIVLPSNPIIPILMGCGFKKMGTMKNDIFVNAISALREII